MPKASTLHRLLLGTAMSLPLAAGGYAQTIQINEDELSGKSAECQDLAELVQNRDEPIEGTAPEDVVNAINDDNAEECATLRTQIASAGEDTQPTDESESAEDSERVEDSEQVSEEVELSEEATIEGEAEVTVPEPEVDVQVPPPNVRVTESQPQVDITQEPSQIELQQDRPRIAVEIPEIIVRVEIPAPQLYVLRQDPEVLVTEADPQVEVEQGEPQVSVRQDEPQLNVDLDVDAGEEAEDGTTTANATGDATGQEQQVEGDVSVAGDQPQVEFVEAEGQPTMTYESGEPQLSYENVEPEITVLMAEQPTIELQQTGEATVVLETAEEREQRRQQRQEQQQDGEQAANDQQQPEGEAQSQAGGNTMTVGELMDMEVVTADGEELGSPTAFVELNGEPGLVLESGGFLGIGGKEVAVPMSRVSVQDEQLLVENLTEEEIEAASEFEYDENVTLPEDREIQVGS